MGCWRGYLYGGADLHMAQLMPLPLTVSCFSKIQIGFTFLGPAHLGSPGKGPLNGVCVNINRKFLPSAVTSYMISNSKKNKQKQYLHVTKC